MKGKDILNNRKIGDGMTTPPGYFDDLAARMAQALPPTEFENSRLPNTIRVPRSLWQRVRPFVYMAAMFAGIWCMLQMFDLIAPSGMNPDNNPTLADAIGDDTFINEYFINETDVSDYDLMDDLYETGFEVPDQNHAQPQQQL